MFRLSLPNLLSLSRIILLPLLLFLLHTDSGYTFLVAYILIGSTDCFDGMLARKLNLVTSFGKILDSVADVLFYISTVYFLYYLFPDIILNNKYYVVFIFSLLGLSLLISCWLFRKPVLLHTRVLRFNAVMVYLLVIASFWLDTTLFVRAIIFSYSLGITEQILIFIFFGNVDPDTKSIFHLLYSKK